MHETKTIHVIPGSELDRLLEEADEAPIELEKSGARYRVSRVTIEPASGGDTPAEVPPDAILQLIGIGSSDEPTDIGRYEQEYLADAINTAHQ